MSPPCLEGYYKAAQLKYLVCWCIDNYDAKWKELEFNQLDFPLPETETSNLHRWMCGLNNGYGMALHHIVQFHPRLV